MNWLVDRREIIKAVAGVALTCGLNRKAIAAEPIYLADMHYHLFFGSRSFPPEKYPLGPDMAGGQATLVAWSLVSDLLWMGPTSDRHRQKETPKPGEVYAWFQREVARIKRYVAEQKLKLILESPISTLRSWGILTSSWPPRGPSSR